MHLPLTLKSMLSDVRKGTLRTYDTVRSLVTDLRVPIFGHSYDLIISTRPGVRHSNSTITAFLSSYIFEPPGMNQWNVYWRLLAWVVPDVSTGWRIILVKNLLTERGFLNGHDGKYPWSSDVTDPRKEPPCPSRDGLIPYIDGKTLIPILHSNREFSCHNISCSRTQFSTTIAYAILFIRPLSMMFNIGDGHFVLSLTYVVISRVKLLTIVQGESDTVRVT